MNKYEVTIIKMVHQGYGLARINGKVVFVPNVLENEIVEIEITSTKKSYDFARLITVKKPSPHRTTPECEFYPECGACHFLHSKYSKELEIKKKILLSFAEAFEPEDIEDFVYSKNIYHYKTATKFIVKEGKIGYYKRQSHELVPITSCLILDENINNYLKKIKEIPSDKKFLIIKTDNQGNISSNLISYKNKKNRLEYKIDNLLFKYDYRVFFQSNKFLLEKWLNTILNLAKQFSPKKILDVYCGAGVITLYLASKLKPKKITGIDINNTAINFAKVNREKNKIYNSGFQAGRANKVLKYFSNIPLVILNPPRIGAGFDVIKRIVDMKPDAIIYSSCEISNFTRDANYLKDLGYRCRKLIPIDMFPRSFHFEVIGLFTP